MANKADVNVELRLTVKGGDASEQDLKKLEQAATNSAEKVAEATAKAVEVAAQAAAKAAEAAMQAAERIAQATTREAEQAVAQSTRRQRSSYERLSHARDLLGMRSEQAIQREIQRTTAAYDRLLAAGKLSCDEQARAAERLRARVEQLTKEMGKLTKEQQAQADQAERIERGRRALYGGAAVVAGAGAAAYTLKAPMDMAMSFDERVGLLANTAYAERDVRGRKLGDAQILEAVNKAIGFGMTKDAAMQALEKLVADNQMGGIAGALEALPYIGKVSTGSGSSGESVAALMGSFRASGYAKDVEDAKRLMGISTAAASAGAFEKGDMAKHLPALLPKARAAGLTGDDGFKRLLVLLQQARTTAGSSDEAATNVANLLPKLSSNETAVDFKRAGRGDLYKYLMAQRAQGVDPLSAWQNTIDAEIAKNPNLRPLIEKVRSATSKEKQDDAIEALKGMAEGQSIARFFQDMQAQNALFGMRNKGVEAAVNEAIRNQSDWAVDTDYASMRDRPGVKRRVAGERMDMAKIAAMDGMTPAIGKMAEYFGDLASKYPLLAGATMLATAAVTAFAGAAGMAAIMMGGGRLPGAAGSAIDRAAQLAASPMGQRLMRGVKVGGLAGAGALVGGLVLDQMAGEDSAISRYGNTMLTGAALGATVGSIVPVIGTGIGAAVGAAGGAIWESIADWMKTGAKTETTATINLGLAPGLVVTGQQMQTSGPGSVTMNTGSQWGGAPR